MMSLILPYLPLIAYILVLLFVTLYAVLSSIEFGIAAFMALKDPLIARSDIERYFGPAWESTNVFLIFSMVGLVMFFPSVVPTLAGLYALVSTALLFFLLRVVGIFGVFYAESDSRIFRLIFAAGSFLAPLTLSGVFSYALTGMQPGFPPSTLLWSLWGAVGSAIIMLSASFVQHVARTSQTNRLLHAELASSGVFLLSAGGILSFYPSLIEAGVVPTCIFLGILVMTIAAVLLSERGHPFAAYLMHALSVGTLIYGTALSHLPYLIYPTITIAGAFTAPQMFIAMLEVVPFGLMIAIPTVALLWHLFARAPRTALS